MITDLINYYLNKQLNSTTMQKQWQEKDLGSPMLPLPVGSEHPKGYAFISMNNNHKAAQYSYSKWSPRTSAPNSSLLLPYVLEKKPLKSDHWEWQSRFNLYLQECTKFQNFHHRDGIPESLSNTCGATVRWCRGINHWEDKYVHVCTNIEKSTRNRDSRIGYHKWLNTSKVGNTN